MPRSGARWRRRHSHADQPQATQDGRDIETPLLKDRGDPQGNHDEFSESYQEAFHGITHAGTPDHAQAAIHQEGQRVQGTENRPKHGERNQ